MFTFNIVPRGSHIKKTHTECIETWKSILRKSELEITNKLIEENAYHFF